MPTLSRKRDLLRAINPWAMIGAMAVLLPLLAVMSIQDIRRQQASATRLLVEKGAALIRAFEAGTRTGMMGGNWGDPQLQRLLSETARQPDIAYLVVVDGEGWVMSHSDPTALGRSYGTDLDLAAVAADGELHWRRVELEGGEQVFELYRRFTPSGGFGRMREHMRGMMGRPPAGSGAQAPPSQVIFVGLDLAEVEAAQRAEIRHTLVSAVVMLLVGLAGVAIVFLAQGYRVTRLRLSRVQAFSDNLVANMPVGLVALDRHGSVATANHVARRVLGIADAHQGRPAASVLPAELLVPLAAAQEGRSGTEAEISCRLADGRVLPLEASASALRDEAGAVTGQVLLFKDLSEVYALRQAVARSQRLAAVGKLAAGVAHEIRNPLSSIKGFATYFRDRYRDNAEDGRIATVMIGEVDRLNRVVSQLMEVARPVSLARQPVSPAALVENTLLLVGEQLAAAGVTVQRRLEAGRAAVALDADRVGQVLLNLVLNAIEAMQPGGGTLSLEAESGPTGAVLRVGDTGRGIAPEDLPRIFDPYFTTKSAGTGLGLAIAHNIVEAHGGQIGVESRPGQGTRFTLRLPAGQPEPAGA
jgi:two-component system sensor histidine kinase HydH